MAPGATEPVIGLFELAFDPEEGGERLAARRKIARKGKQGNLLSLISPPLDNSCFRVVAPPPIDSWMTSFPRAEDLPLLNEAVFRHFVTTGGCRAVAGMLCNFLREWPAGLVPGMLGVDHSCTGGIVEFLSRKYGAEQLGLLIFDAHFDAVPQWARAELLDYAKAASPHRVKDKEYSEAPNPGDPYHCGSFVGHLFSSGLVRPEHTVVLGVSDSPPSALRQATDARARRFVQEYDRWIASGVRVVTRQEILTQGIGPESMQSWLSGLRNKRVHISFDADVACGPQTQSVRFKSLAGLALREVESLLAELPGALVALGATPAGFDLVEIDPNKAGKQTNGRPDRTLVLARRVLAGWTEIMRKTAE